MADTAVTDSQNGISTISSFDLHDPRTLMLLADRYVRPKSFLKDFFFPTGAGDMFSTETVLVDSINRGRKLAPFVISGSKEIGRDTFVTDEYKPPRIAPARIMTVDNLKKRGFGESLFDGDKPNVRATRMTVQDMIDLSDMITRREEVMASEILRTNQCVMVHVDGAGGANTQTHTIKFYSGASNDQTYTPSVSWATVSADIIGDINEMVKTVKAKGNPANILLVSPDVAMAILNNTVIKDQLNNRRMEIGSVVPYELPEGASSICRLNVFGRWVDVLCYEQTYQNDSGADVAYLPAGTAILTGKACGRGLYGGVVQLEHGSDDFKYYEGRRVPKIIKDVSGDSKKLQLVSAPVLMPVAKFAWISSTVIFATPATPETPSDGTEDGETGGE